MQYNILARADDCVYSLTPLIRSVNIRNKVIISCSHIKQRKAFFALFRIAPFAPSSFKVNCFPARSSIQHLDHLDHPYGRLERELDQVASRNELHCHSLIELLVASVMNSLFCWFFSSSQMEHARSDLSFAQTKRQKGKRNNNTTNSTTTDNTTHSLVV